MFILLLKLIFCKNVMKINVNKLNSVFKFRYFIWIYLYNLMVKWFNVIKKVIEFYVNILVSIDLEWMCKVIINIFLNLK